jgi:hypothetical protein
MTTLSRPNQALLVAVWACAPVLLAAGWVLALSSSLGPGGDTADANYEKAIASGRRVEWVKQMDQVFPGPDHSISYFTGEFGKPQWASRVGLFGRYVLIGEMDITLSDDRTKIIDHLQPKFHLIEIARINVDPNSGQALIENGDTELEFGTSEWKKLIQNKGDFSALKVKLVKDKPVPLFDKHWKNAG